MESNLNLPSSTTPKLNVQTVSSAVFGKDGGLKGSMDNIHGTVSKLAGHVRKAVIRIGALEKKFSELEKKLIDKYQVPVFVTHWPKGLKPFYMKKDDKVAYCFDLIFPEVGELIGGSEREDSYDVLKREMEISGLDMEKMDWYLKTRKWGSVPHSGFGLGFDRLVTFVCGLQKIHDSIPFPISY